MPVETSTNHIFDKQKLVSTFTQIGKQQMSDIPIYNNKLDYHAEGFHQFDQYFIGILCTPWFMNLMAFPVNPNTEKDNLNVGEKCSLSLPGGNFEFTKGYNDHLGEYFGCSLLSPVFELASQEDSINAANAAYAEIMTAPELEATDVQESEAASNVSRRDLITGFRSKLKRQSSNSNQEHQNEF